MVLGPLGNGESLEEGVGLSVERDFSDSLEESCGMEVLCVDMPSDIRFSEEFLLIHILNSDTNGLGSLGVVLVSEVGNIRE